LGITPELIESSGGIFDVHADGGLVFSKFKEGGHADAEEVIGRLRKLFG
jgi:predicted Rdx family selenoprotein